MKEKIEQLANEERKAYHKKWRQENRDKVRQHQNDYWIRRAEKKMKLPGGDI